MTDQEIRDRFRILIQEAWLDMPVVQNGDALWEETYFRAAVNLVTEAMAISDNSAWWGRAIAQYRKYGNLTGTHRCACGGKIRFVGRQDPPKELWGFCDSCAWKRVEEVV